MFVCLSWGFSYQSSLCHPGGVRSGVGAQAQMVVRRRGGRGPMCISGSLRGARGGGLVNRAQALGGPGGRRVSHWDRVREDGGGRGLRSTDTPPQRPPPAADSRRGGKKRAKNLYIKCHVWGSNLAQCWQLHSQGTAWAVLGRTRRPPCTTPRCGGLPCEPESGPSAPRGLVPRETQLESQAQWVIWGLVDML